MKIGIMTFSSAINYGAVLQAYGLKEVLGQMGHDTYVIDYQPHYFHNQYYICRPGFRSLLHHSGCVAWFNFLLKRTVGQKFIGNFRRFLRKNLNLLPFSNINKLDAVVFGSDQIWNPLLCDGNFDKNFFGQGIDKRIKKVAYAPSVGNLHNLKNKETEFKRLLEHIDYISAREENFAQYITNICSKKSVSCVLDPTLLAGREIFEQLAKDNITNTEYLLFFDFFGDKNGREKAVKLAQNYNLSIIEPFPGDGQKTNDKYSYCSPEEFCSLIKNAKIVVTTSFHGTAFSILFNRPFYALEYEPKYNDRILSLLKSVQLTERFIYRDKEITDTLIDWENTNTLLAELRVKSKTYLYNALESN